MRSHIKLTEQQPYDPGLRQRGITAHIKHFVPSCVNQRPDFDMLLPNVSVVKAVFSDLWTLTLLTELVCRFP